MQFQTLPCPPPRVALGCSVGQRGFTLVELILVIVILGVLAVFAAPRMFDTKDVDARGFYDETMGYLRYAQKTAIAQRRMVCVTFNMVTTPHTMTLTMENPTPAIPPVSCGTAIVGPRGEGSATVTAKTGITYTNATNLISSTTLIFDGLGQPVTTARVALTTPVTVQVANSGTPIGTITIEAVTGYVHE